jgi:hypothetical protein
VPTDSERPDSRAPEPDDSARDEAAADVIAIAAMEGSAPTTEPEIAGEALAATEERTDERADDTQESAIADIDGEAEATTVTKDPWRWSRPGSRAIATLLATAAILAALITTRASMLSGQGGDGWQTALRNEVKRSAAVSEDVRFVYQNVLPIAMLIETARIRESAMRDELAAHPESAARLNLEIAALEQVQANLKDASLMSDYKDVALPSGGFDLGKVLAQNRNENPDLVALDPDADTAAGDVAAAKARRISLATIPIAIGVLLGALAEPFVGWRRRLLWLATVFVAIGATAWIVMELFT